MDEKSNQSRLADKLEQEKLQQQQVQQKKDEREKKRKKIAATLSFENDFDDQGDKRWTYGYTSPPAASDDVAYCFHIVRRKILRSVVRRRFPRIHRWIRPSYLT